MTIYWEDNTIFYGCVVGALIESLQNMHIYYKTAKEMWDTLNTEDMWDILNTEYRGLDAGTELYIIEQYYDY
jgi:hypothetical protein